MTKRKKLRTESSMLIRLLEDEERTFKAAAQAAGETLSTWVRRQCRQAAGMNGAPK